MMYGLKTSCNGISQVTGRFDNINDAKLAGGLAVYMFVQRFSKIEEFDTDEGENWCSAKGKNSGFEMRCNVIEIGA